MSRIEKQAYYLSIVVAVVLFFIGFGMLFLNSEIGGQVFSIARGKPYSTVVEEASLPWWGVIFLGLAVLGIGMLFKFSGKK